MNRDHNLIELVIRRYAHATTDDEVMDYKERFLKSTEYQQFCKDNQLPDAGEMIIEAFGNGKLQGEMDQRKWWINRIKGMIQIVKTCYVASDKNNRDGYVNQEYVLNELLKGIE